MTAPGDPTISVVIPTKNAAHLLRRCLPTVAWADEILLVDTFSDDGTAEVCAQYPQCRVVQHDGLILEKQNYGFERARGDWVMRLDTDEHITPELAAEIRSLVRCAPADLAGYACWERPVVLGRELRHGYGRRHHRKMVFRRGTAHYPVRTQHDDLEGRPGDWIPTEYGYLHYNYNSPRQFLSKAWFYSVLDVGATDLPARAPFRTPVVEFLRSFYLYFLKWRGYRDGWIGLVDATLRSLYPVVFWVALRQRVKTQRAIAD